MPTTTCLALTPTVKSAVDALLANGCEIDGSIEEGHLTVTDDDVAVYRAIQEGKGQPWIVSYCNSERISWTKE